MKLTTKEEHYLKAKEAYYEGDPIIEDWEFDELEAELDEEGSLVLEMVGFKTKGTKVTHLTKMKSLDKIQFQLDYEPIDEFFKWVKSGSYWLENSNIDNITWTPKFDGNAVNLIYSDGKLQKSITRGDGEEGQDITDKLRHMVPNIISNKNVTEIRGEVVIPKTIFEDKYAIVYSNPRNFVAGMLNRDQLTIDIINDLDFMAFDVKLGDEYLENDLNHLKEWGFKSFKVNYSSSFLLEMDFLDIYNEFKRYREEECPYLIDGIVVKMPVEARISSMEKDHHPLWALAIKYPPKIGRTTIIDIEWNLGTTGVLIPVAILEPVDLDGSIVKRVTLHNFDWATNKKCGIGARIEIVKSGDIIPKVLTVLEEGDPIESITEYNGCSVILDGVHLRVENYEELPEHKIRKLHHGITALGIKGIGPSLSASLFYGGVISIVKLFFTSYSDLKESLIKSGEFKEGRELELLFENINKIKEVELWKVVNSFKFKGVGKTMSKEIAKEIAGVEPDYSGLEKAVVKQFHILEEGENSKILAIQFLSNLIESKDIKIINPEIIDMNKIGGIFELTGSPKEHGFKVKADFLKLASDNGYLHGKLNIDCNFLLTDSMSSTSSKMKKAEKLGVEIITYSDFVIKYLS